MNKDPKVFLSYSHSDKEFAVKLAEDLRKQGIDIWIDKWEIQPGDSIIQKIFLQGLADTDFFLILLSSESIRSKWVAEELNAAIVKKMEGITRIIPVIKERCDVPLPLRTLLWVDLSSDYDEGIRTLVKTMHGVSEKPPLGKIPEYVSAIKQSVGGLSKNASTVGALLLTRPDDQTGFERSYSSKELQSLVPFLKPDELNDVVDELESYGLVKTHKFLGTAPYNFGQVTPTYALFLHFKNEGIDYDPMEDVKAVAAAITAKGQLNGDELRSIVQLPPVRLNRAVSYLEDYGYVQVYKYIGTAPYNFGRLKATRHTRQFVQEHGK
ncbi:MAG: toll/interleukin-1 receptor domain-containing protein [Candidatus Kuenenia sp.]|nr:toll/interleukin-1 receptor domain-containing protein [Candidatus Kuenenia hertensis]